MDVARLIVLLFAGSLCGACGGNAESTSTAQAGSAALAADAGKSSSGAFANIDCDPAGDGVCENDSDCELVHSGKAREWAVNCGTSCLGTPDEAGCARDCLKAQTGLTEACGECYVKMAVCSREHCLPPCLMDAESRACFDCQVQEGCRASFDACTGLPPVPGE